MTFLPALFCRYYYPNGVISPCYKVPKGTCTKVSDTICRGTQVYMEDCPFRQPVEEKTLELQVREEELNLRVNNCHGASGGEDE